MNNIEVTVCCITYNHEKYIVDAIEGFLMQETGFSYEIVIHDDASTDSTAEIVKQYESRYPNKIIGVYQEKNQYSQGADILFDIMLPMARGKYIALCEGDDYWTEPYKLQKQVEAMELHPECYLCAHAATIVDAETKQIINEIKPSAKECIFVPEEVIAGGGGFVATNSLFIKRDEMEKDANLLRGFSLDYFLQIMGSIRGGMLYLADSMSSYRWMAKGSWSEKMHKDLQMNIDFIERCCTMLNRINMRTGARYKDAIEKVIEINNINQLELKNECKYIVKNYSPVLSRMPRPQILRIYIKAYFPWLKTICDMIRGRHDKQQ